MDPFRSLFFRSNVKPTRRASVLRAQRRAQGDARRQAWADDQATLQQAQAKATKRARAARVAAPTAYGTGRVPARLRVPMPAPVVLVDAVPLLDHGVTPDGRGIVANRADRRRRGATLKP